jgi:maltooligosyltrehalose trehalohydrolase
VYDTYRELIALRRAHPELTDPRLDRFRVDTAEGWLLLHRGTLRVAVNLGTAPARIPVVTREVLFGSPDVAEDAITLAPDSAAVVRV